MSRRDRRAALRAVEAAIADATGKLGDPHDEPPVEPEPPSEPGPPSAEALLPDEWRARLDDAAEAEPVEVHGERVRRHLQEETVYLATRVPRSLRDAVRRRADRLEVTMQDLIVLAMRLILDATARAAEE